MPNYDYFEGTYRRLMAEGKGWNTTEELAQTFEILERFCGAPEMPKSGRALELGCGAGDISIWLAKRGFAVAGVDISETAVAWARERFAKAGMTATLRVGSVVEPLEFAEASFDLVVDGHCFHCILGEDRPRFLANAFRVLRPGGVLHLNTMCGEMTHPEWKDKLDPKTQLLYRDGVAIRQIRQGKEILGEMEAAGFHVRMREEVPPPSVEDQTMLVANGVKPEQG